MQSDIVGQVLGVTAKQTRNGNMKYDVAFSDGQTYTTFDSARATKAQQLVSTPTAPIPVSARVDVGPSRDGKYTNHNLEDIAPLGQLPAQAMPVQPGTPIQQGFNGGQQQGQVQFTPPPSTGPSDKDKQIARGNAANAVAALYNGVGDVTVETFLADVDAVARYIAFGIQPGEVEEVNALAAALATPEAVAAAVPGVQVGTEGVAAPAESKVTW